MQACGLLLGLVLLIAVINLFLLQDPLLRRAGMFTVAMAYCGSGDNRAIRRLLHVAVSI